MSEPRKPTVKDPVVVLELACPCGAEVRAECGQQMVYAKVLADWNERHQPHEDVIMAAKENEAYAPLPPLNPHQPSKVFTPTPGQVSKPKVVYWNDSNTKARIYQNLETGKEYMVTAEMMRLNPTVIAEGALRGLGIDPGLFHLVELQPVPGRPDLRWEPTP